MVTAFARAAALVGAVFAGTPQDRPDFSGKWAGIPGETIPADLPNNKSLCLDQDREHFTVGCDPKTRLTYRLDGAVTKREERIEGVLRTITAKAAWVGSKLAITEEYTFTKRETIYSFTETGAGKLTVTGSTTMLHERGGALSVSTIGPFTRAYKKSS